jgi:uncharacterized protein YkwD
MTVSNVTSTAARPLVRALAAALTTLVVAAGLSAVTAPAHAKAHKTGTKGYSRVMSMSSDTYESKVRYFINKRRANHGLAKLSFESCTDGVAERWARQLADTNTFYHQDMGSVLDRCNAYYAGETLGRGAISPYRLVQLWMQSPPHRHVLLSKHAKRIGVGAYVDGSGLWVTAANFTKL